MTASELWAAFEAQQGIEGAKYEAWAFGEAPDELAELVCRGIKTATASAYDLYAPENEPLPQAGEYSVLLDGRGEARCIIRTTRVYVAAFEEVTAEHARREGEGDLSLDYWRSVHARFFADCLGQAGLPFDEKTRVVCEEFDCLFCPAAADSIQDK